MTLAKSTIGPNVSIGAGSKVEGSTLSDTIIGRKASIKASTLTNSLVGDDVTIEGLKGELTVSDHSEIRGTA
jgi:glucose-1-phosphate thymidylyltransferase